MSTFGPEFYERECGIITTKEAILRILKGSWKPLSLLEVQAELRRRFGILAMDSVGRRIREMRLAEHIQIRKRERNTRIIKNRGKGAQMRLLIAVAVLAELRKR